MMDLKNSCIFYIIRYSMSIGMVLIPFVVYSQEKKFSSFELLYDLPQQMAETDNWPKYGLDKIQFNNDTLFTILLRKDHIAMIPMSKIDSKISFVKAVFPDKKIPVYFTSENKIWYFITTGKTFGYLNKEGDYTVLISNFSNLFEGVFFINKHILTFDYFNQVFVLFDINGKHLSTSRKDEYAFMYPYRYQDKIIDGYNEITVLDDIIHVSEKYDIEKYGNERSFVGGSGNMGYFVDWDNRGSLVVRELSKELTTEKFKIPVKFKSTDSGLPEEELINLRVFSQDNNTFYFVTLKHGHLLIYKAVR